MGSESSTDSASSLQSSTPSPSWEENFANFESPIDVDCLRIRDGTLYVTIYGDSTVRVVRNLQGRTRLSRNFKEIELNVGGDADTRWPIKFPCRGNRRTTAVGVNTTSSIFYGNLFSNFVNGDDADAYVADPTARVTSLSSEAGAVAKTHSLSSFSSDHAEKEDSGGRIDFKGSLSLPSLDFFGTVKAKDLHVPLLENIFDLPVKMEDGRVDGEFEIVFPQAS